MNKCGFLLTTGFAATGLFAEIGAFAMIKHPLSQEYGLAPTFLGTATFIQVYSTH